MKINKESIINAYTIDVLVLCMVLNEKQKHKAKMKSTLDRKRKSIKQ